MNRFVFAIVAAWLALAPAAAAVVDWTGVCSHTIKNPNDRRDPSLTWDTSSSPIGTCPGYDNTIFAISPCNNAPCDVSAAVDQQAAIKSCTNWVTVPMAQFDDPKALYRIQDALELRITGRVNITGGVMYLYYRAPGSDWFRSNNQTFEWNTNVSFTMPVAQSAVQYMLVIVSGHPNYTVNFIIDGWCL